MTEDDLLAVARSVQTRDTTPEQEAIVVGLAEAALDENADVMDAAEMLFSAASMILLRSYAPAAALRLLRHMTAVLEVSIQERVQ